MAGFEKILIGKTVQEKNLMINNGGKNMIKNLSQLKKAINEKKEFKIVRHYIHPDYEGQVRVPNIIQTNGFYSVEKNKPDSKVSAANNGKGIVFYYGKARDWSFEDGLCRYTVDGKKIWDIKFEE